MDAPVPSIYIEAPAEKVFAFWANPENLNKLTPELPYFEEVIEDVTVTPDGVGTTYRTVIKVRGVRLASVTDRYVEVEPNRRIVDQPTGLNPAIVVSFAPEGSGTRVSMEAIPVPWTARVPLLGSGIRTFHHRRFGTALQTLKKVMEAPVAALPAPHGPDDSCAPWSR